MQLVARKKDGSLVLAAEADRRGRYLCPGCGGQLRLRGGHHRQLHFYHRSRTSDCQMGGKGMRHLAIQLKLQAALPGSTLECPFPTIGRIADLYWPNYKIVFEIQCSPISSYEVEARKRSYRQLGLHLVWILSDHRFNQRRCSAGEIAMTEGNHYFSSIDAKGVGEFYDQWSCIEAGVRTYRLRKRYLNLSQPSRCEEEGRTVRFAGDYLSCENRPSLPSPSKPPQKGGSLLRALSIALLERLG